MEAQDLLLVESMAPLSSNKQKEERWGTFLVDSNHSLRQLSLYCRGPWITIWIGVPIRISLFRPRRQDDWGLFSYTHASYPLQDHHKEWNLVPLSPKGKTSCIHRSYSVWKDSWLTLRLSLLTWIGILGSIPPYPLEAPCFLYVQLRFLTHQIK